ncbi:A-factor biosynthesis repeat-containing protein [Leptospira ryugenii]|uniref:A-factor biosynthesis repeat-containing protein n=1 Tax=Leptospira ryugenii TaxID=1917863 RepID=A0A2P2E584_9LEPT|nr:AfsA-related hotdog domain-containing protein [Leptospira ryugenii]GBF52039.1 A-factor biosynthesis repeat-containing protein [Leptospira ryugenii]
MNTAERYLEIPKVIVLDKAYTRVYNQEDSFVSNMRRALPREIPLDDFEIKLKSSVSDLEYNFVLNYYEKRYNPKGDAYFLRSVPQRIRVDIAENFLSQENLKQEDRDYLLTYYDLDTVSNRYILKKTITEADEIKMLKMFRLKSLHINNVQKAMISEILEKVPEIEKKSIFFANLYTHPKHVFFSPPNLKHISGMQITEAARQFAIATCHKYGNVPFTGVTFLLQHLKSEFFQYAKVNMPIKMRAITKELKLAKDKSWNYVDMEITVYQENIEISRVSTVATILPLKLYKRLKSGQEAVYEIDPRFRPSEKFKNNISIRYRENGQIKKWVCHIENFSMGGFLVKSGGTLPPKECMENQSLEFFMHFDIAGFVHGFCKNTWTRAEGEEEDTFLAGFSITEMTEVDRENLKEAIGRFGRLIEERDIY